MRMMMNNWTTSALMLTIFLFAAMKLVVCNDDEIDCLSHNSSCEACVKYDLRCYYCADDNQCHEWKGMDGQCKHNSYWRTCKLRANIWITVLIILFSLVTILSVILIIWCCCIGPCCRRFQQRQIDRWDEARRSMNNMHQERQRSRQQQRDHFRAKHGLTKSDTTSSQYTRFS
uniref:Uncharacterized protein LOC113793304 n=1 Tax=Dermatophagoides pteronyssinus TaxID=6956 RepID=A0A6P6Y0X7_DERPT|nr:uncharacterized protein LOC113793304 [Dermatophagoides pteronyssinus]